MANITISSRIYSVGETVVDLPQNLARRFRRYSISFTREGWPAGIDFPIEVGRIQPNVALVFSFERSVDGTNWANDGLGWAAGGLLPFPSGPLKHTINPSGSLSYPNRVSDIAFMRARLKTLVPLRTEIVLSVEDE